MKNLDQLHQFIETYNFATLINQTKDGVLQVSHVPVMLDRTQGSKGTLAWHLAKKNPQIHALDGGKKALFIFHGPHAYISPRWYETTPAVPTWNYAVVRAQGIPQKISLDQLEQDLSRLLHQYEGNNYLIPEAYQAKLKEHIAGFSMEIENLEATFKLGQNRSEADQAGMLVGLSQSEGGSALAEFIQQFQQSKVHVNESES